MSARDEIAARLWLSIPSKDNDEAKAGAEEMLDAYRVEVLTQAKREVVSWLIKKAREGTPVAELASKVDRGAVQLFLGTEPHAEPLIVSRFDVAIEPAPEEEPILTIGCIAEDGRPVALLLDVEDREKVAGWLTSDGSSAEDEERLALLLDAIRALGGRWTTRRVQRLYRLTAGPVRRCAARQYLVVLRERGHLRAHGPGDGRFYTLATPREDRR